MISDFRHEAEYLRAEIEQKLTSCGILCRVFGRGKSHNSLQVKLSKVNEDGVTPVYKVDQRLIQDAIGIRVVVYFSDDVDIARSLLCESYLFDESASAIDRPKSEEFSVTRYNLIFKIPDKHIKSVEGGIAGRAIDSTFEVQLRSVLSEGWHEVEHDLRYKKKDHWVGNDDLSRSLNGIVAALETSEWGMRKIFEDLAYRHYKAGNWDAMLLLKLRMRMEGTIDETLNKIFDQDRSVGKKFLRMERLDFFLAYNKVYSTLPLTASNVVYISNLIHGFSDKIKDVTPERFLRIQRLQG